MAQLERSSAATPRETEADFESILGRALGRIAPLWPLDRFVAVNPYLGLGDLPFEEAAKRMAQVAGARMTMPRAYYREALASGTITDRDLLEALTESSSAVLLPRNAAGLRRLLDSTEEDQSKATLPTLADLATGSGSFDWSTFVVERISTWAAGHFGDEGSVLPCPWRELPAWEAWRREAMADRTPEIAGVRAFRSGIKALSADPKVVLEQGARRLGLSGAGMELYFHRLLMTIGGWAAHASRLEREGATNLLRDLLALRLAWELALLNAMPELARAWNHALARYRDAPTASMQASLALELLLLSALEKARRRQRLTALLSSEVPPRAGRARAQAIFCIDVRSEVMRRAIEKVDHEIATFGFAGFFGMPVAFRELGAERGEARCPVLIAPRIDLHETSSAAGPKAAARALAAKKDAKEQTHSWRQFKNSAVSSFAFVETLGLGFAFSLLSSGFGPRPRAGRSAHRVKLQAKHLDAAHQPLSIKERADLAESTLRGASLGRNLARLVLFVGHGSTSTNNLHASGLDCGACGGHAGDANATLAADIFNDIEVRHELAARGIEIPEDTIFLAALHDTTSDEIAILDRSLCPAGHEAELLELEADLRVASAEVRQERARRFGIDARESLAVRGRDWSQTRPEWGLAGCSSFIAAPRSRSFGADLGGRAFLHSYDWQSDRDFAVLEQIMTAPMIVASWINLQYHGSTVDNRVFGCGDKTMHNAVGTLGVLEGNGGDLRTGLPWQSIHDGREFVHEPLRLEVVIEAPTAAIEKIMARHEDLLRLFTGGWLHLIAIDSSAGRVQRYRGPAQWQTFETGTEEQLREEAA